MNEIRYDLEYATDSARRAAGYPPMPDAQYEVMMAGLPTGQIIALAEARCALIEAWARLGGR